MPKVSIILSSYNHADYIGESIQSILNQTFTDFELYIIDDHSTDNSWEVIQQYRDPRIITLRNEQNIGIVIRPQIIAKLKGEYIAVAHCDDKWEPTKLEKQVKFLDTHKKYAACFTLVKPIDENGQELPVDKHPFCKVFQQENRSRLEWLQHFFYRGNALCHPSILLRTKTQKGLDLYAAGFAALPDEYRWIKIALHHNIYVYQEKLTDFRIRKNGGNTSGDNLENQLRVRFEQYLLLDQFCETLNYPKKDFLTIFPTAQKYLVSGHNDTEYIFARILVDASKYPHYQLYGLKLLWQILQDPHRKALLETKYNFTNKDFIKLSGAIDVFGYLNDKKSVLSTVYYDTGNGFNPTESISQKVYIDAQNNFRTTFDLSRIKHIKNLRFDPLEETYARVKDVVITIDGKRVGYKINSHQASKDGYTEFNTSDPQFLIENYRGGNVLTIQCILEKRNYHEIDQILQSSQPHRNSIKQCLKSISKSILHPKNFH